MVKFKITRKDKTARTGILSTLHGNVETPEFIPVGTKAAVKALPPRDLFQIGAQIILSNTYHLSLRPGADLIEKMGGLGKFMGWGGPTMTDSGGFQVFSLGVGLASGESKVLKDNSSVEELDFKLKQTASRRSKIARITEEGATFYSPLDGSRHFLSPEISIKIQKQLGADLIVAFDDHESIMQNKKQIGESLDLNNRWAARSLKQYEHENMKSKALLYGVVHGGLFEDLRIQSAKFTDKNFEAIAIGGIYGERKDMCKIIDWVTSNISDEKVRHLLGIGEVVDIFNAVERGMDLFDCVAPMRRARFGSIYISPQNGGCTENSFTMAISKAKFASDKESLDPGCNCLTCTGFTRAYLRFLFTSEEILYHQLATYHNVYFIINLMREIRDAIKNNKFDSLKKVWLKNP